MADLFADSAMPTRRRIMRKKRYFEARRQVERPWSSPSSDDMDEFGAESCRSEGPSVEFRRSAPYRKRPLTARQPERQLRVDLSPAIR